MPSTENRRPHGPMGRFNSEKPKDFKKSIKMLFKYSKEYVPFIIIAIILTTASSIFSIIGPDKIKDITDIITKGLMPSINLDEIKSIGIFLIIIYLLGAVFNYIQGFIMATINNKFSQKLRKEISNKINKLPLNYFDKNSYGDVLSRVTNDVDNLSQTINQSIATLFSSITLFIGSLIMMFITNFYMSITAIVTSIIGFVLMGLIMKKSQKYFKAQQEELGKLNGHIEDIYSGHVVVKAYNGIKDSDKKFDEVNEKLFESARKSQFLSGLMHPLMAFIGNFGYVCVCIVGALLVINNSISFGVIVAFMIYIRLFTQPLSQVAQAMTQMQSAAAASERVFKFLREKEMDNEKDKKEHLDKNSVKGKIEFSHVKFGYDKDKEIIKDFTLSAKPGSKIAIVGPTGSGKTTMVNLLMKFYEINDGDIKIDGKSIKDLTRENIHDLFIMVLQDTWLFEGTIKDNIIYNSSDITLKEVKDACKKVGLDHFIKTLPKGYDTMLGDVESLSQGQKQLLTIARGMIKNAPFLILDEATSSVDTRTEELVQKAMDKLTEGRTSFIIAHRLSTIKNADVIVVMKDGDIIEVGNHDELIKKGGFYKELYNSQFEKI